MNGNIDNPRTVGFVPIASVDFAVAGGAAGWVDTDVSGTTGTDTTKVWLVNGYNGADQVGGVRPHGSAATPSAHINLTVSFLSHVDSSGHFDLLRAAGDIHYYVMGYFK